MAKVTAKQVKELREKTGAGMMDVKKALVEADGDDQKATDILREKGAAKAAKKSGSVAAEGLTRVAIDGDKAAIVEVNCQTDFVSGSDQFKELVEKIAEVIAKDQPKDKDEALNLKLGDGTVKEAIVEATSTMGEKIDLRRFQTMTKSGNEVFGAYLHNGGAIGVLDKLEGADEAVAKDVAMHVAALNPEFVNRNDVPKERLDHEREVLKQEALNEGKPEKIVEKMVEGRLNKFLSEISLADQDFVKDPDQTVVKYVEQNGGKLLAFVRYEVGEGIEEEETSFADEVKKEINK